LTENLGFIEAVGVYAIGATLVSIVTLLYHPFHSLRVLKPTQIIIDLDSSIFLIFYFPLVVAMNIIHTYIMYSWSENWAEGSSLLIANSFWHYM